MRFLPVNETTFIAELTDLDATLKLFNALNHEPIEGIVEIIPAARTLMIRFEPAIKPLDILLEEISGCNFAGERKLRDVIVEIPVHYNGKDLNEIAGLLNISPDEVIARHCASHYSVAFTGFAPGFAYLTGGDPIFDVPRRQTPRTRIPAGSVGLAGTFSGIYPQASPGGWQIIGTTNLAMFDIARTPPALLQPGDGVRFVDVQSHKITTPHHYKNPPKQLDTPLKKNNDTQADLQVISLALPVFFQDQGRSGQASQGVSPSGAIDRGSMKAANRLVGNDANSIVLEITLGGLILEALQPAVIALSGAPSPLIITTMDGKKLHATHNKPIAIEKGDRLSINAPEAGLRTYLAIAGGFAAPRILGSSARDTLANLGPEPLKQQDYLYTEKRTRTGVITVEEIPAFRMPKSGETVTLDVVMGPRTDWFTPEALALFFSQQWEVTPQSNRVGNRLWGEKALTRTITSELPSEGTATGAVQVPASGQPVLFLNDRPLTGGYPVIATVADYHLDLAGQLPVGAFIRFRALAPFAELSVRKISK